MVRLAITCSFDASMLPVLGAEETCSARLTTDGLLTGPRPASALQAVYDHVAADDILARKLLPYVTSSRHDKVQGWCMESVKSACCSEVSPFDSQLAV